MLTTVLTAALTAAATPAALPPAAATTTTQSAPTAKTDKRRYCFLDEVTGSRMPYKTCKSRSEWSALGVDVTNAAGR